MSIKELFRAERNKNRIPTPCRAALRWSFQFYAETSGENDVNEQSCVHKEIITQKKPRITARTAVTCAVGGVFILLLLAEPDSSVEYMTRGLRLCVTSVIPTLFPFMVVSGILTRSGCGQLLGICFGSPMRRLFGVGGAGAAAVLLGAVCGFPVGAVTVAAMFCRGELDRSEASHVLSFCNYPSSAFMITAIGVTLFGSRKIGVILLISVYLSGAICGIVGARLLHRNTMHNGISSQDSPSISSSSSVVIARGAVTDAVASSAEAMLCVCAYVAFFSVVTGCLGRIFNAFPHSGIFDALLYSFFELTSGAAASAAIPDPTAGISLCAAAAGWSGLSVHLQVLSAVSGTGKDGAGIPIMPYLISKACQAVLAMMICRLLLLFLPPETLLRLPEADAVTALSAVNLSRTASACGTLIANTAFTVSAVILCTKKLDR